MLVEATGIEGTEIVMKSGRTGFPLLVSGLSFVLLLFLSPFLAAPVLAAPRPAVVEAAGAQQPPPAAGAAQGQPPAANPADTARLEALQKEAIEKQKQTEARIKELNDQIENYKREIARALESNNADLRSLIQKMNARLDALEAINQKRTEQQINADENQYRTGFATLQVMQGNMLKLDFTVSLTQDLNQFQTLVNPVHNEAFLAAVKDIEENLHSNGNDHLRSAPSFISNPYIAIAWSIGSLFSARMRPDPKAKKLKSILCVINAATTADAPNKILASRLDQLHGRITKFKQRANDTFTPFMAAVGYNRSYADYRQEYETTGFDPLEPKIKAFFDPNAPVSNGLTAKNSTALASAKYQVEKVKVLLNEYDSILKEMEEFLTTFNRTMDSYQQSLTFDCDNMQPIKSSFDTLRIKASLLTSEFNLAYGKDISPQSRRILYGSN